MPVIDEVLKQMSTMADGFRNSINSKVPINILFQKIAERRDELESFTPPSEGFTPYEEYTPDEESEAFENDQPEDSFLSEEFNTAKKLQKELEDLHAASQIMPADEYFTRIYEIDLRKAEMEAAWYLKIMALDRIAENIPSDYHNRWVVEYMKQHNHPIFAAMCELKVA